jgi:hypothetical protein
MAGLPWITAGFTRPKGFRFSVTLDYVVPQFTTDPNTGYPAGTALPGQSSVSTKIRACSPVTHYFL